MNDGAFNLAHDIYICQQDGPSAPRMSLGMAEVKLQNYRSRITELEETLLGKQVSFKSLILCRKKLKVKTRNWYWFTQDFHQSTTDCDHSESILHAQAAVDSLIEENDRLKSQLVSLQGDGVS